MTKTAALVLIALAAGLGLFVGRWSASRGQFEVVVESLSEPTSSATPGAPAPSAAPDLAARGDPVADAFRDALARLPAPEVAQGNGSISGTVRAADGQPIPGVLITVNPQDRGRPWKSTDDMAPEVAMRQYAESLAWTKASRRSATTGGDGAYVVDGLSDGALWVQAKLDGWRLNTTADPAGRLGPPIHGQIRAGWIVNFVGTPTAALTFDVRMPNGTPASSASIEWRNSSGGSGAAWKAAEALTTIDPGTWKVTARSGDDGLLVSETVDVVVEAGKPATVRLDLREQPAIRLRIRWPEGEAFPNPTVRIAEIGPDDKPDPSQLAGTGLRQESPTPFSFGGTHLIRNVVLGRYVIGVTRYSGDPNVVLVTAVASTSVVDVDVTMPPVPRERYVIVRVLDPNGKPLSDLQMQLAMRSSTRSWSGGGEVLRRPDGSMWLFSQQQAEAPRDARFFAIATSPDLGTAASEYLTGLAPEATIRFQSAARVEVACEGAKGSRIASKLTVGLSPVGDWKSFSGRSGERLSREGVATIGPVQPVPSEIVVIYSSDDWGGSVVARVPIDVTPGPQRVVVSLPRLHSVTFRLKAGVGSIHLRRDDDPTWRRVAPASGETAVVDGLPDGAYRVNAADRNSTSFSLPGTTEVDLR